MGRRRTGILLVLLVLLVLLAVWWSSPGLGPPAGPTETADELNGARPPDVVPDPPAESGTAVRNVFPAAAAPPPRRSGPADLGPGFGSGLGSGLSLSEPKQKIWLTGRLVDADGKPLAGISVRLEGELTAKVVKRRVRGKGPEQRILQISAGHFATVRTRCGRSMAQSTFADTTDGEGRFEIPAPPARGNYRVVFARGKNPWDILVRTGRYRFTTGASANLGTVKHGSRGSLTGRITDTAGGPIAGASVSYWPESWGSTPEELLPRGEAPVDKVRLNVVGIAGGGAGLEAVETDEDGKFTIRNVIEGTHTVIIRSPYNRKSTITLEGIQVREGEEVAGLAATLEELMAPLIAGRVFSEETGEAIRASVHVRPGPGMWQFTRTNGSGRFVADRLAPGEYEIRVFAPGHVGKVFGPYPLAAGQRLEGLELRLALKEK